MKHMKKMMHHLMKAHDAMKSHHAEGAEHHKKERKTTAHDRMEDRKNLMHAKKAKKAK